MDHITRISMALLMACIGLNGANAQSVVSSYTSTAPKDCRQIGKPSDLDGSTTRVCPGKDGLVVLIAEDDLLDLFDNAISAYDELMEKYTDESLEPAA